MYTSGVQCITQNKIPIKLPRTKQFGYQTISNHLFWEFDASTKSKQTKIILLYWKKKKCENWVNSTSQGNLTSASGFRICDINDPFNSFLWVGFVEWLSCIKLFHAKEFDLVWKPNIHCDMLDIHVHVFPKVNILAVRGKPTVNKSIIDKNIMPLCFSHML